MGVLKVLEPTPQKPPLKRSFVQDLDPEVQEPAPKRRREGSLVHDWLNNVLVSTQIFRPRSVPLTASSSKAFTEDFRSQSVPPGFNDNQHPPAIGDLLEESKSFLAISGMGDPRDYDRFKRDSDSFSQNTGKSSITKIKPISSKYRDVLEYNNIEIDPTGSQISQEVRSLLDTDILKKRTSPPLSQDQLKGTMESMNKWGGSTENVTNSFITSSMFPVHHSGISLGGNSPWPRTALPYDPDFGYPISTPKPDYHVGYEIGKKSGFSAQQAHVINHPYARPYTQPGTGNCLPFLTLELKSEATGGTLYHAENQAAGSGTYSLRAMEWLLDQAKASQTTRQTDTVAFSIAGTGRMAVLSVHWYSPEKKTYYMSYVKGFLSSESEGVQNCHSTVKNIIEWGLGSRHTSLGNVLQQLFPLTEQWTDKRTSTAAELDYPGDDDEGEEDEMIGVVPKRMAKSRRSSTNGNRRSSVVTQSFTSTQSLGSTHPLGDRCSTTSKKTSVTTKGSESYKPKPSSIR